MAASPKILIIQFADKAALAVALGILGYVVVTSFVSQGSGERRSDLDKIASLQRQVTRKIKESRPPGEIEQVDLTRDLKERFIAIPDARELRPYIFTEPTPQQYDKQVVHVGQKITFKIDEPPRKVTTSAPGFIKVEFKANEITVSGLEVGETMLKCVSARGMSHEVPIEVKPVKINPVVGGVSDLAFRSDLGRITLTWVAPPKTAPTITAFQYDVVRRHESEPEDKAAKVATVSDVTWTDTDIKSGETYYYKIQPIAVTPDGLIRGPQSKAVRVVAKSSVEFDLNSAGGGRASFEVRAYINGEWNTRKFFVARGGLIGEKVRRYGVEPIDFSTGCVLVDIDLNASRIEKWVEEKRVFDDGGNLIRIDKIPRKREVHSPRVIYQDRKGNPRILWQRKPSARVAPKPPAGAATKPQATTKDSGGAPLIKRID